MAVTKAKMAITAAQMFASRGEVLHSTWVMLERLAGGSAVPPKLEVLADTLEKLNASDRKDLCHAVAETLEEIGDECVRLVLGET